MNYQAASRIYNAGAVLIVVALLAGWFVGNELLDDVSGFDWPVALTVAAPLAVGAVLLFVGAAAITALGSRED